MPRKTPFGLLALVCALAVPAFTAPAAFADPCTTTFEDAAGYDWDLDDFGSVGDGEADAYDSMGYLYVAENETSNDSGYSNPDTAACTYEDEDREIVYPTHEDIGGLGVDAYRKVYVPADGNDFARWLDILENPGDEPVTVTYEWYGEYGNVDSIAADEDGDGTVSIGERWAAIGQEGSDTDVTSLWDGPFGDSWDRTYQEDPTNVPYPGNDYVDYMYDNITIPAGGRAVFMHIEHQDDSGAAAAAWGEEYNAGADEFFAGMSDEEMAALRNWAPDVDGDGVANYDGDNCPETANGDQADLDGDGLGDVCDDDIDGDGFSNEQEANLGTNPANADSDGDGTFDGLDQCPTRAGNENGCPPVANTASEQPVQPVVLPRLTPNRVTLNVVKRRPSAKRLRLRSTGRVLLPAGVAPAEGCRSGAVIVTVKSGGNTVSSRIADVQADCTYRSQVIFTLLRRLGNRKLTVRAHFTGNDRLNRRKSSRVSAGRP